MTVKEIIAEMLVIPAESVKDSSIITDDLRADSIDIIELIMKLEDEYNIDIKDEDAEKVGTVGQAIELLRALGVAEENLK